MTDSEKHICPPDHQHGRTQTCRTTHACRCPDCLSAARIRQRQIRRAKAYGRWQPAHVSPVGTQRRLQALVHRGWSQAKLAEHLGITPQRMPQIFNTTTVARTTADKVDQLFRELWHREPPQADRKDRLAYERAKRHARRRGWAGPLDWDDIDNDAGPVRRDPTRSGIDETAVELAVAGTRVHLTISERREAVRILHGYGLTDPDMAKRLELSDRTILRIRLHELHLPANDSPHNSQTAAPAAA